MLKRERERERGKEREKERESFFCFLGVFEFSFSLSYPGFFFFPPLPLSFYLSLSQDTMKGEGERGPVRPMKRAVNIALAIMGSFYLAVALSGEGEKVVDFFVLLSFATPSPSHSKNNK